MLSDDLAQKMEAAAEVCDAARDDLEDALDAVDQEGAATEEHLQSIGAALEDWRDGQQTFMALIEEADVPNLSTAAMLLKTNRGIDVSNARRGLPGVPVEGTDQPFDLDLTGRRGGALTEAAMQHVSPADDE